MTFNQGKLIVYQSDDGRATVDVRLEDETVWLTQAQMQELFGRERSVITKHINNVFKEGELERQAVCAKFAHTAEDGKTYKVLHYNLDVIISVGYRVKSQQGTRFRIWATSVLKDHLVKGYTFHPKRIAEKGLDEARQVLELLGQTLQSHELVNDDGKAVLDVVNAYARTWKLLLQYDEDSLPMPKPSAQQRGEEQNVPEITTVRHAIASLKKQLLEKGEATELFGRERGDALAGILGAIRQTFGGRDVYPTVEEKAAHLLYFVIKDHPFTDGNKRIGSFLFLVFLQANGMTASLPDSRALVALTLLIAAGAPEQKGILIRLIANLLQYA